MKALILAGGAGTRLRPITHTSAKQLVPVANKPILFYGLEAMAEAGIKDVGIIVGDTADEVMAAVGDGSAWGLKITYIPQDAPLGLAHCVLIARDFLGDADFVMYLGDNLIEQGVKGFVDQFETQRRRAATPTLPDGDEDEVEGAPVAQILLARVPDPHRFGVADLDSAGRVVQLVEKPSDPPSDLALVGVYLFDRTIHDAVRAIKPSGRGELEITDAIQWLIDHGHHVCSEQLQGWWIDTGKLTPLLEANRLILETIAPRIDGTVDAESQIDGRVVIEAGASIIRSQVRGPAIIGSGTRIEDSFIGPFTAVDHDCQIVRTEIEHSVILPRARVIGAGRLEDSLLGRDVEVTRSERRPRATRMMVGDHCQIDLR
ncbi:MAG TPA: sugar phosphate nucleotidyltransferase [Acidimicrobiales bacterium]